MASTLPRALLALRYEEAAQAYLRSLPLEHFMEATAQAKQREITLASLALLRPQRPDLHLFNELLVQYPLGRSQRRFGQVVPDNMVVLSDQPIRAESSYNVPLEPAKPFWVLEYVSKNNPRKDYEDSFRKYERDLKVLYYLVFYPDVEGLTLYRHTRGKYVSVKPNGQGRCALPELDLEVGLLDGWVRYWYKGKLLPLPADLQREVDDLTARLVEERRRADEATRRAEEQTRRADELTQRLEAAEAELIRLRSDQGPRPRRRNGST